MNDAEINDKINEESDKSSENALSLSLSEVDISINDDDSSNNNSSSSNGGSDDDDENNNNNSSEENLSTGNIIRYNEHSD